MRISNKVGNHSTQVCLVRTYSGRTILTHLLQIWSTKDHLAAWMAANSIRASNILPVWYHKIHSLLFLQQELSTLLWTCLQIESNMNKELRHMHGTEGTYAFVVMEARIIKIRPPPQAFMYCRWIFPDWTQLIVSFYWASASSNFYDSKQGWRSNREKGSSPDVLFSLNASWNWCTLREVAPRDVAAAVLARRPAAPPLHALLLIDAQEAAVAPLSVRNRARSTRLRLLQT